jgi:hypothetical protein
VVLVYEVIPRVTRLLIIEEVVGGTGEVNTTSGSTVGATTSTTTGILGVSSLGAGVVLITRRSDRNILIGTMEMIVPAGAVGTEGRGRVHEVINTVVVVNRVDIEEVVHGLVELVQFVFVLVLDLVEVDPLLLSEVQELLIEVLVQSMSTVRPATTGTTTRLEVGVGAPVLVGLDPVGLGVVGSVGGTFTSLYRLGRRSLRDEHLLLLTLVVTAEILSETTTCSSVVRHAVSFRSSVGRVMSKGVLDILHSVPDVPLGATRISLAVFPAKVIVALPLDSASASGTLIVFMIPVVKGRLALLRVAVLVLPSLTEDSVEVDTTRVRSGLTGSGLSPALAANSCHLDILSSFFIPSIGRRGSFIKCGIFLVEVRFLELLRGFDEIPR